MGGGAEGSDGHDQPPFPSATPDPSSLCHEPFSLKVSAGGVS